MSPRAALEPEKEHIQIAQRPGAARATRARARSARPRRAGTRAGFVRAVSACAGRPRESHGGTPCRDWRGARLVRDEELSERQVNLARAGVCADGRLSSRRRPRPVPVPVRRPLGESRRRGLRRTPRSPGGSRRPARGARTPFVSAQAGHGDHGRQRLPAASRSAAAPGPTRSVPARPSCSRSSRISSSDPCASASACASSRRRRSPAPAPAEAGRREVPHEAHRRFRRTSSWLPPRRGTRPHRAPGLPPRGQTCAGPSDAAIECVEERDSLPDDRMMPRRQERLKAPPDRVQRYVAAGDVRRFGGGTSVSCRMPVTLESIAPSSRE